MIVALDNGDQFVWPVLKPWEPFTVEVQGSQVRIGSRIVSFSGPHDAHQCLAAHSAY